MKKGMTYTVDGLKVVEYDDSYKFISDAVGGLIEHVYLPIFDDKKIDMWCNDEGKLLNFEKMLALSYEGKIYDVIVGNLAFTRSSRNGNTLSLTDKNIEYIKKVFNDAKSVIVYDEYETGRKIHIVKCLEVC